MIGLFPLGGDHRAVGIVSHFPAERPGVMHGTASRPAGHKPNAGKDSGKVAGARDVSDDEALAAKFQSAAAAEIPVGLPAIFVSHVAMASDDEFRRAGVDRGDHAAKSIREWR